MSGHNHALLDGIKNLRNPCLLARCVEDVFSLSSLSQRLASGKPLRIKFGADVTAPTLHLGHAVNLWLMRELQEQGHKVVFLIGDFTTQLGDPSDRDTTRPRLEKERIERDAAIFEQQVRQVLLCDPTVFEVRRNSEWWGKISAGQLLEMAAHVTHARLISRDMFQRRLAAGQELQMHEMLYPLVQGWDSVELQSDLTIIGSDQLFNENMARSLQERAGQQPQTIITSRITMGLCGKVKQSKSLGNFVGLADSPRDKFGKVMSLPDELIVDWLETYTTLPLEQVADVQAALHAGENPVSAKKLLAREIVSRWHGSAAAQAELHWFEQAFGGHKDKDIVPDDVPLHNLPRANWLALDLVAMLRPDLSRSQCRRLLEQGAITLDGDGLAPDAQLALQTGQVLKTGKRHWHRVVLKD